MKKKLLSLVLIFSMIISLVYCDFLPTNKTVNAMTSDPVVLRAENYSNMSGVQTETCSEGGKDVSYIDAGDWMSFYSVNLPVTGQYTVEYRVASLNGGGVISLEKSGGNPVYGTVNVPSTGGWQNWQTISQTVTLNAGAQDIGIGVPKGGYNIEWIKFTPVGDTPSPVTLRAENYSNMSGVQTETCSEGGKNVSYIDAGDWLAFYSVNLPVTGQYTVEYRIASLNGGGVISLEKYGGNPVYGTVNVPSTGGWQNWQTISQTVTLNAGAQDIGIGVPKGGYNIEWIKFTPTGSTPVTPPTEIWNNPAVGININGQQANGSVSTVKSSNWDTITTPYLPGMAIVNNLWGIGKNGTGSGSIFTEKVNNKDAFGWSWNMNSTNNNVVSYQEVGWGWSPNSGAWFNGAVPLHQISENKSYTVDFNLKRTNRSGAWDTAFDIWSYPQTQPTGGSGGFKGGYEIMVWLDHEVQGPWGSNPQDVYINGHHFKVYDNDGSSGWRVISYINQDAPINDATGFSLSNFWNDAATRYSSGTSSSVGLTKDHYINAIEFGSESCGGQGMLEVQNYNINIGQ
ncbi:carbohydrate-binding protein [Clostridium felsineum]|uniref:carbohydrate-binding protein n=1 Tax=Clostridium felsineum TaxID=36839 RepID=UPI00098CDB20|nr:carbohydrate-binding protein [Clostridium felsineum]URZ00689.1 hypothetical protein CLAUR_006770 [Clostridium felsineum]